MKMGAARRSGASPGPPAPPAHEPLLPLQDAAKNLNVHFSTILLGGQFPHQFFLRQGLIKNFQQVAKAMNDRGWILHVEDGYRTPAMQRGLSQEDAVALVVNGFVKDVLQHLPMEFAVEAQKLIAISLEGSVG